MQILFDHPILHALSVLPHFRGAYLVGGAVRDLIMSRNISDIDVVVPDNPEEACRAAATALNGTAFVLDKEREVWRTALPQGAQVDISRMKSSPPAQKMPSFSREIFNDLSARDFTIDAMALPFPDGGSILDPFGGIEDIGKKLIRALSKSALSDDPLRLMRAFRLARQLDFHVDGETLQAVRELSPLISDISPERVRDELYIMLEGADSHKPFREMAEAGLLEHVLPETKPMSGLPQGEAHQDDLLGHSLKAMEFAEDVMLYPEEYFGVRAPEVARYLNERADGRLTMRGLIKLAALLHDSGKPATMSREADGGRIRFTGHDLKGAEVNETVAARLKLSSRAKELLSLTARHHMRPLHMTKEHITRHAMYRYVRDMEGHLPASLTLALADAFATREKPESVSTDVEGVALKLSEYYYGEFRSQEEAPLLKGRDLISEFKLKPGPVFSRLLNEVREKRAEGTIKTRDEAIEYVRGRLK
ncbi:MAG: HD domain-containing protein [Nitrospirota bacterium]